MMFSASCMRARLRLQRRASGLSPGEALRLEEHLAGCEACREQAVLLDRLTALSNDFDPTLPRRARERVITGAFAYVRAHSSPPRRPSAAVYAGAGLALAGAAALALVLWQRAEPAPQASVAQRDRGATAVPAAASGDRVLAGAIDVGGRARAAGTAVFGGQELSAPDGAELALAHATVALRPQTRVRWDAQAHALALLEGSVLVEVDPSRHQPFSVHTARFRAEVLGTRFEVDLQGVRVERGTVRVVASDGRVLAPALLAGQRFTLDERSAALAQPSSAAGEPSAPSTAPDDARERGVVHPLDARTLLQRARASLAQRDAAGARRALQAALSRRLAPGMLAEARSLAADCSLVEGDVDAAVRQYVAIARKFAPRAAAQNALFAAARLQAERGREPAARALFAQYVQRYPAGALAEDARRRLAALGGSAPAAQPDAHPLPR